ncbi:MAG TPA: hypothetical protein ENN08_00890 [Bacteroidales bacterium]|nr:hypothetical protein [Bacteroidales bacterium]
MKKLLIILSLLICCNALLAQQDRFNISEEKAKILRVIENYIVANETQNIKLMEEVWAIHDNIEAFGTAASERLQGWEALKRVFVHQFNTFTDTYISARDQIVNIDDAGNVAWFSQMINYNFLLEGTPKRFEGVRHTGVLKKIDGQWKMMQMHLSMPH